MQKIKGFISIKTLINNAIGIVSPLGETTTYASTFSKERGEYFDASAPEISLITTYSADESGNPTTLQTTIATHILTVAKWVINYGRTTQNTFTPSELRNALLISFPGSIVNPQCGLTDTNGDISLPQWVSWENNNNGNYQIKIWFSNAAFVQQYDESDIVVIPPVDNVNVFFNEPAALQTLVNSRTVGQFNDKVVLARNKNPETVTRVMTFNYTGIANTAITFPTNWYVLVYGAAGDNNDSIRNAIINYILANSNYSRTQWQAILPDLFKQTEFTMLPRWDKYAIPNMTLKAGMYSPLVNAGEAITFAKAKINNYPQLHIEQKTTVLSNPFKSLQLVVVGGNDNINSKFLLSDFFPDYISENTDSVDFSRMSVSTQNFCLMLNELLIEAERATDYSDIPLTMRKVTRNGILYISQYYENVLYLVAARKNYPATA